MNTYEFVEQYAFLCNLIEAIWDKRNDKEYWKVDFDNLPNKTSPQARKIANVIIDKLKVY